MPPRSDRTDRPRGGAPTRRTIPGVALVAAATVTALVIAELVLRAAGFSFEPYPRFYPQGVARGAAAGVFESDADLLWVSSSYRPALDVARRERPHLLLLGDSCTAWGDWPDRLAALAARNGVTLSLANLAVGGWSTFQGLEAFRRDALPLAPRVVMIYFGWNDHWNRFGVDDATAARLGRSAAARSGLRLGQLWLKLRIALHARRRHPVPRVPPEAFRENLRSIVRLARERNVAPIVITAASAHEPGKEPSFLIEESYLTDLESLVPLHRRYVEITRSVAAEEGAILCDPEREFAQEPAVRRSLFREDGIHLSAAGNQALASLLLDTLEENGLLQRAAEGPAR